MKAAIVLFISTGALVAQIGQYPGQYPPGQYPPGQYPPGQYPPGRNPGNTGPSIPGRSKKTTTDQKSAAAPTHTFSGVIRHIEAKSLDLEASDTRTLTIQLSDKTTKPAELKVGDGVDVVATEDQDGQFHAVSIKSNPKIAGTISPSVQAATGSAEPEEPAGPPPTIVITRDQHPDADDSGPPKLKRGIPVRVAEAKRKEETNPPAASPAAPAPAAAEPSPAASVRQAFVEKARAVAATFIQGLPNYVCQQITTRYTSETKVPSWNVIDVVSAELVYESGKESYRNLVINGKASKKSPEESGAWSYGEFGTILEDLFSEGTAAKFKYVMGTSINRLPASVYDFEVERVRSSWKIKVPGQFIFPAYKGSVWIDKESAHVLRIEMQARNIPAEFPRVTVETTVDYEYISLGTPDKFLLPVRAEVLSCARGSNECERNVIEFRNYHKFTGQSTIDFKQ